MIKQRPLPKIEKGESGIIVYRVLYLKVLLCIVYCVLYLKVLLCIVYCI